MDELNAALQLTLPQQFQLRRYQDEVKGLSGEESREYLLELARQLMIKDNVIKHLMKSAL
jgi:hypothetical protein